MTLNARVVSIDELAAELGPTIERLLGLAEVLAGRLGVAGVRLHNSVAGMRLLPASGSPFQRTWRRSRAQLLKAFNRGDVHLLYEVAMGRVEGKRISHRRDGILRLHKLEGAELMELTSRYPALPGRHTVGISPSPTPQPGASRARAENSVTNRGNALGPGCISAGRRRIANSPPGVLREIHAARSRIGRDLPGSGPIGADWSAISPFAAPLRHAVGLEEGPRGPIVEFRARQNPRSIPGANKSAARQLVDLGTARGGNTGCSECGERSASRFAAPRAPRRGSGAPCDKRARSCAGSPPRSSSTRTASGPRGREAAHAATAGGSRVLA